MGISAAPSSMSGGSTWSVYVLKDPLDMAVRYVGLSYRPEGRLKEHMAPCNRYRYHVNRWINVLVNNGRVPVMEIVEAEIEDGKHGDAERRWIAHFKSEGCRLTNLTDGGEGVKGLVRSVETIEKMRKALTGRRLSPEHRATLSRVRKGRKMSAEVRQQMIARNTGRKRKPETLARMSAARLGKKASAETRAKISAALTGRVVSEETRRKKSITTKGRVGKPWSEEAKLKMSQTITGIKRTSETRAKMCQSQIVRRSREQFLNSAYLGGGLYV